MNEGFSQPAYQPGAPGDEWETPDWLFRALDHEFKFELDAAATVANSLCGSSCFTKEKDALSHPWRDWKSIFINPPYSNVQDWVDKAFQERESLIVMLLPAFGDKKWYCRIMRDVTGRCEVRPFNRRIRFWYEGKPRIQPRFASMVVIFRRVE